MSSSPRAEAAGDLRRWAAPLAAFVATLLVAIVAYRGTIASMVNVWSHSDTFAYGFLVAPISLYLVWKSRDSVAPLEPRPAPLALVALVPLGFGWILGRAASVLFIEQLCFVAMIPILVIAFLGQSVARRIAFPLGFLFFMVPFGDVFQPALMEITADLSELALRLTGLPVAREGLYLITTTARWHVVESCSGLRFTVAGVVLATFFAYLSYRSPWKRLIFVAGAVVVSILANGFRAYVLILIGHLTDMKRGQGFDHYAYGWLVFTAAMVAFFMVGAAWRDREDPATPDRRDSRDTAGTGASRRFTPAAWAALAGLAIVLATAGPVYEALRSTRAAGSNSLVIAAPSAPAGWIAGAEDTSLWRPFFHGAASEANRRYDSPAGAAQCYIGYYADQAQGRELLHKRNTLFDVDDPAWRIVGEGPQRVVERGSSFTARETILRVRGGSWVLWHWYWIPDEYTTSPLQAKWLQARSSILGHRDHAAVIVLGATARTPEDAERLLTQFAGDMLPSIRRSLRAAYDAR